MFGLDKTFCSNSECPKANECERSLNNLKLNTNKYLAVSSFVHDENGCEYFIQLEKKDENANKRKNRKR